MGIHHPLHQEIAVKARSSGPQSIQAENIKNINRSFRGVSYKSWDVEGISGRKGLEVDEEDVAGHRREITQENPMKETKIFLNQEQSIDVSL